ncbi:hypothetical protein [Micromonospora sp. NBC_00421]|uniref:hypothetical protein n=1 Tax=Micromonospora sp. NBC_00421 TaxID=2975976 RepID=UPI002E20070C
MGLRPRRDPRRLVGAGWWINNLPGTNDRVKMALSSGGSYTTPHSPSQDLTADWYPVYELLLCVA